MTRLDLYSTVNAHCMVCDQDKDSYIKNFVSGKKGGYIYCTDCFKKGIELFKPKGTSPAVHEAMLKLKEGYVKKEGEA